MTADPTPLSRISDQELQARMDRFVDHAMNAEARFREFGDVEDHMESEQAWWAVRALSMEEARRRRLKEEGTRGGPS